jgi:hypothetical protein
MGRHLLPQGVAFVVLGLLTLPVACASASACPNEALRSELRSVQLPDCRAYELVSPVYKEGQFIASAFAVSQDGSRFIGGSLGAFGGAKEDEPLGAAGLQGVAYEFSRAEPAGWSVSSLVPPASMFSDRGMVDAAGDLGSSLWELGTVAPVQPEGVSDLYLERPRGTFTKVGPVAPNPHPPDNSGYYDYLGASTDLSHVLFSVEPSFRWPFDGTVSAGGTLYEYVGVGRSEPSLVGVNGGGELVSQCGTRLGSSGPEEIFVGGSESVKGSMYNAISTSGARIFFTAVGRDEARNAAPACQAAAPPVGEVFDREESPSGEMRTVAISEPSKEDCEACLTSEGLRDAVFQGASEDGSKVFFTTKQELLAGARGENLYEYDFDAPLGERIGLLSVPLSGEAKVQGVARISEDGSHVYFVAKGVLTEAPNGIGNRAEREADNLYVSAEGHMSFVATLSAADGVDWQRADARPAMASKDGQLLVFSSAADLTDEGLIGGRPQVFQYDAQTGGLVRASIGQDGYDDDDRVPVEGSTIASKFPNEYSYADADSPAAADGMLAPEDGAVFFQSPDALTPDALNDQLDSIGLAVSNIYEYRNGSVYLLSDGKDVSVVNFGPGVYLIGSDPSGDDVFFFTSDPLIPEDGDTQQDVYDARVNGGLPTPSVPLGCAEEACRGPLAGTPALPALGGSATQAEEESPPPLAAPVKPKPKPKAKRKAKARRKARAKVGRKASRAGLSRHARRRSVR